MPSAYCRDISKEYVYVFVCIPKQMTGAKRTMLVFHITSFDSLDLETYFSRYGQVESFSIIPKGSRTYAKLRFITEDGANTAFNSGQIEEDAKGKKSRHNIGTKYCILKWDSMPDVDEDKITDPVSMLLMATNSINMSYLNIKILPINMQ